MSCAEFGPESWRSEEEEELDLDAWLRRFLMRVQRLCVLIVSTDYPLVDIQIERANLREEVERFCPDRIDVYDRIYESRFDRLIEQFRGGEAFEW